MRTKLSLHIMNWEPLDATTRFLEVARPRVIKVMDSGLSDNKLDQARGFLPPGGIVVGRVYFDNPNVPNDDNLTTYNPRAAAQETFNAMRQDIDKMGARVDAWEGFNELGIDESNQPLQDKHWKKARHFADFTVELAELLRQAGRKHAAYSFSTGNPNQLEIWEALEPGVLASDYLALHEYIYPGEDYTTPDLDMCRRHRQVYAALSPKARQHVKMIITECGADLHGVPGSEGGGYKKKITDDKYWQWLREYDEVLLQDPYVLGATIYTYGASQGWQTYDISGAFTKLMMNRIPDLPEVAEPAAPPVEPVTPTKPVKPKSGIAKLADIRGKVQDAIEKLKASDGDGARDILVKTVNPWFYQSAPDHSDDLEGAQAHTQARWFSEESTRRIEANKLKEARDLLQDHVLAWMNSGSPAKIGVLGIQDAKASKPKTTAKKMAAKKIKLGTLSAAGKSKSSKAKKKTTKKK